MRSDAGKTDSIWAQTTDVPLTAALQEDSGTDVCIVGGGIAGLSAAYLLAREGRAVMVIEDGQIGGGESGRTTGHLSYALDDRYYELERLHGPQGARLAAESHMAAIDRMEEIVREEQIDCEFERVDGYLFSSSGDEDGEELELELASAHRAGLKQVRKLARSPLRTNTGPCLLWPSQAMFHPLKYLTGLAQAVQRLGGSVFTRTHAEQMKGGDHAHVIATGGLRIDASAIIVATNTPVNDLVQIHTKQAAYRTYVIGAPIPRGLIQNALYWDTSDPYHYVRLGRLREGHDLRDTHDLLLVGGEDHKTGQEVDTEASFDRLERWARTWFPVMEAIEERWSGQVLEPVDCLAFLGRNPGDAANVYIATGDSGHGLTHATIGGMLLTDLLQGRENRWAQLYDPARRNLRTAAEFARQNLNVARQYLDLFTGGDVNAVEDIKHEEGAVVRRGLQKVAVHRDAQGELHEFSAVCPHLGCVVEWNTTEKTWDCPCHGSRFDVRGKVINGPANTDLDPAAGSDDLPIAPITTATS